MNIKAWNSSQDKNNLKQNFADFTLIINRFSEYQQYNAINNILTFAIMSVGAQISAAF